MKSVQSDRWLCVEHIARSEECDGECGLPDNQPDWLNRHQQEKRKTVEERAHYFSIWWPFSGTGHKSEIPGAKSGTQNIWTR